jgi:apolipoprotein N-acyltransferase
LTVEGYGETYGRAGIQICYEIVFSGQTVDRDNRPDYIFNPSNDGWFGTWGPPQHLGQARMRAIEEGLPVLRSTTDGISAVIDADGVVRQHIESGVDGSVSGFIPPAKAPTLFAKLGNALPLLWAGFLLIAALLVQLLATRTRSV